MKEVAELDAQLRQTIEEREAAVARQEKAHKGNHEAASRPSQEILFRH